VTTTSATESNVICAVHRSSRIAANRQNTGSAAMVSKEQKTVTSKKKSVGHTKKRVHSERLPKQNASNKNMCNTIGIDNVHAETMA